VRGYPGLPESLVPFRERVRPELVPPRAGVVTHRLAGWLGQRSRGRGGFSTLERASRVAVHGYMIMRGDTVLPWGEVVSAKRVLATASTVAFVMVSILIGLPSQADPGQYGGSAGGRDRPQQTSAGLRGSPALHPIVRVQRTATKQTIHFVAPRRAATGRRNAFAATSNPALTGRKIALQRQTSRGWRTIATAKEDPAGSVSWNPRLNGSGTFKFRAHASASHRLPAVNSATATVKMTRPPAPGDPRHFQLAVSLALGSTEPALKATAQRAITSVVTSETPAGILVSVTGGTIAVSAASQAGTGSATINLSGKGCFRGACSTPYTVELDLYVDQPTSAGPGVEDFTTPSPDRVTLASEIDPHTSALSDEVLVVLGTDASPGDADTAYSLADGVGAVVTGGLENVGIYQLRWPEPVDTAAMISTLESYEGVEQASPSAMFDDLKTSVSPPGDWSDDGEAAKWPFTQMRVQQAWSTTTGGDIGVGILEDDAPFKGHEDLAVARQFGSGKTGTHATHVAGLACAKANGKGLVGVAWGCPITAATFNFSGFNRQGVTEVLLAAEKLAQADVGIINMSIGVNQNTDTERCVSKETSDQTNALSQSLSSEFRRMFNSSLGRDIVWTISAGNNCGLGVHSPWGTSWALPNVITVAATNSDGTLASFSNFGAGVEVAAPGGVGVGIAGGSEGVWSTWVTKCGWFNSECSDYKPDEGTSMSAPMVAGVAELLRSAEPGATAAEVGSCIVTSAGTKTGTVTTRSSLPSSAGSMTVKPKIPYSGSIPIVDADAAMKCVRTGTGAAQVLIAGAGDRTSSGNGTDRGDLFAALSAKGYTVLTTYSLPPDLSGFGQVWYLDTNALTSSETSRLESYLAGGGSVYLTGERECCTDSDSVVQIINDMTLSDWVTYQGDGVDDDYSIENDVMGITSIPHDVSYLHTTVPGTLSGVSSPNIVADNGDPNAVVWAAYGPADMAGGGKLVTIMDINWLAEQYRGNNWGDIVENIAHFLGQQGP